VNDWGTVFVAALAGGVGGGLATVYATARQQVREARARLVRNTLKKIGNDVNDVVQSMEKTGEPQATTNAMGRDYSDLVRDAQVAGRPDNTRVNRFWPIWTEVCDIAAEWKQAKEGVQDEAKREEIRDELYARQHPEWVALNQVLKDYARFVRWQLTRPRLCFWLRNPPAWWKGEGSPS